MNFFGILNLIPGSWKRSFNLYIWRPIKKTLYNFLQNVKLFFHQRDLPEHRNDRKSKASSPLDEPQIYELATVGTVHSVYKEKFGTPRQGNLVPDGRGCVVLDKRAVDPVWSLDALDQYSHVWIVFIFHANTNVTGKRTPNSKIRPPQAAGQKIGVFATRSPHRPNPIGLTMAKISSVDTKKGILYLDALDLCDGTPVLDIKPYCEHVDWPGPGIAVTPAWVKNPKFERTNVEFTEEALCSLRKYVDEEGLCEWYAKGESDKVIAAITDVIALDPRDLNRGRGAFSSSTAPANEVPVKETSFTRREDRIKEKSVSRHVYVRFDELDVTFKPDDATRSFVVLAVDRFRDRKIAGKS